MPAKKYKVTLSTEERQILEQLTTTGKTAVLSQTFQSDKRTLLIVLS
jgi:hypothetical protein